MSSVESITSCKHCGGENYEYFDNEESHEFCFRCGSFFTEWMERDDKGDMLLDKDQKPTWGVKENIGYGIHCYFNKKENKTTFDTLLEPLTPEQIQAYTKEFCNPTDEKEMIFLTEVKDGTVKIHLGTAPHERHILTEKEMVDKYNAEEQEKLSETQDSLIKNNPIKDNYGFNFPDEIELTANDLPDFSFLQTELPLNNLKEEHVVVYATESISRKQYFDDSSIYGWVMIGTANQIQLFHLYLNPAGERFILPKEELKGQAFQENLPRCFHELSMNLRVSLLQKEFEEGMK